MQRSYLMGNPIVLLVHAYKRYTVHPGYSNLYKPYESLNFFKFHTKSHAWFVYIHKIRLRTFTSKNALNVIFVCENVSDRHDIAFCNSLPSFLHSKSLNKCLHYLNVLVKSFTLLVADHAKVCWKKVQVRM